MIISKGSKKSGSCRSCRTPLLSLSHGVRLSHRSHSPKRLDRDERQTGMVLVRHEAPSVSFAADHEAAQTREPEAPPMVERNKIWSWQDPVAEALGAKLRSLRWFVRACDARPQGALDACLAQPVPEGAAGLEFGRVDLARRACCLSIGY